MTRLLRALPLAFLLLALLPAVPMSAKGPADHAKDHGPSANGSAHANPHASNGASNSPRKRTTTQSGPTLSANGGGGGCPNITSLGNFLSSNDGLAVAITLSDPAFVGFDTLATYEFTSNDETPTDGVPGLISYCVYPEQPPGNPDGAAASALGANGDPWDEVFHTIQGYFAFQRPDGNPSNIGFDGSTVTIGTATWAAGAPQEQVVLLHINDADECDALYGGDPGTCFVYPGNQPPPQGRCPGTTVACKEVVIDEAITSDPLTVPARTLLHIHYTYIIQNTLGVTMGFKVPTPGTKDVNSGGGKDYFGCEQLPDPSGAPGTWGAFPGTYQGLSAWKFTFSQSSGTCNQSRFTMVAYGGTVYLAPGESIVFTVDMVTRSNKGRKQEYTSCGPHILNSGFTVKWFQSDEGYTQLHSFSTNGTPLVVDVTGC